MKKNFFNIYSIAWLMLFVFPIHYIETIFKIQLDKLIMVGISCILIIKYLLVNRQKRIISVLVFILIVYRFFILKDIFSINLIILILCLEIYDKKMYLINIKILKICLISTIFYSLIYYGENSRIIHTSIKEINQSGMTLFLLCSGFYAKKEYKYFIITSILLILTFSRTALLSLVFFLAIDNIRILKNLTFYIKNFYIQLLITFFLLFGLANSFEKAYFEKKIVNYKQTFFKRIESPYDYSNFFRFTINKNIIDIMNKKKKYLINGIKENELKKENFKIAKSKNMPFRNIKPHNFMFSYLQIYGIPAFIIFLAIGKILNLLTTKKNICYIVGLLIYSSLLGVGLNSYYLILVISLLKEFNINRRPTMKSQYKF